MPRGQYWAHSFRFDNERKQREPERRGHGEASEDDTPCARGEWCASGAKVRSDDGTTRREPVKTPRTFCRKDETIIAECLAKLPALHGRLHASIGVHVTRDITLRVPFGPSVPLRLDIDEIMRLVVDAVLTWHERVADTASLVTVDTANWRERSLGMRSGELLPRSVAVLAERIPALLGLEDAVMLRPSASPAARLAYAAQILNVNGETALVMAGGQCAGNEILRLEWLGRAALLETPAPAEKLLGVACRECERRALRRAAPPQHDGDPEYESECLYCGDLLAPDEYKEWTALQAAYQRNTATLAAA